MNNCIIFQAGSAPPLAGRKLLFISTPVFVPESQVEQIFLIIFFHAQTRSTFSGHN